MEKVAYDTHFRTVIIIINVFRLDLISARATFESGLSGVGGSSRNVLPNKSEVTFVKFISVYMYVRTALCSYLYENKIICILFESGVPGWRVLIKTI